MNCNKCGSPLPNQGAVCQFCGAMMDQKQIEMQKSINDKKNLYNPELKSDRYGVEKNHIFNQEEPKENKLLGFIIITVVVVVLIILAILLNV